MLDETVIFGSTMCLMFFTEEYITDDKMKYNMGFCMLGCIAISIIINISVVLYMSGK